MIRFRLMAAILNMIKQFLEMILLLDLEKLRRAGGDIESLSIHQQMFWEPKETMRFSEIQATVFVYCKPDFPAFFRKASQCDEGSLFRHHKHMVQASNLNRSIAHHFAFLKNICLLCNSEGREIRIRDNECLIEDQSNFEGRHTRI